MDYSIGLRVGRLSLSEPTGTLNPNPPVAAGSLPDIELTQNIEMTPVDVSVDFTGPNITFALGPASDALPAGLVLSGTGVLSGTPEEPTGALNIVIRATNSQGTSDSSFSLTIAAMLLDFDVVLEGLTANPTYGPSAQDGVLLTASAANFTGAPPASVSYQWSTVEQGPIAGATSANYAPDASMLDTEQLFCTVSPAGYPPKDTSVSVIRQVPPMSTAIWMDEILDLDSGPATYDAAGDFTGPALVYSVTGPGTSVDAATGLVTILTDSPVVGADVIITAENSGGSAQSGFTLTVEEEDVDPGPDLALPILNDSANTIELSVDIDCTIYWRRDPTGTNPTAAAVIAGGGYDNGSFAVTTGANSVSITFAPGNDGVQQISFVAAVTPTTPSNVQSVLIDIDTTLPVLSAVSGTPTGSTSADWSVTSSEAGGMIFAAVRLASDPALLAAQIETGTGNAVALSAVGSPTADANNAGSFSGLMANTSYVVDAFQRDAAGNEGDVISSSSFATEDTISSGIEFVGSASVVGPGGVDLTALTGGSGNTALEGDLVIVFYGHSHPTNRNTDVNDGSYTEILGSDLEANGGNLRNKLNAAYKFMGSTPDTTVGSTWVGISSAAEAALAVVFRGVDQATPFDDVAAVTGSPGGGISPDPTAITPNSSGAKILSVVTAADRGEAMSLTIPANMSEIEQVSEVDPPLVYTMAAAMADWAGGAFDPGVFTASRAASTDPSTTFITLALKPA